MTYEEWREKENGLYQELREREADLDAFQKRVVEAMFHRDTRSHYQMDVERAHRRILERMPSFLVANLEHAQAKMALELHKGRKPLDCTKRQ